MKGQIPLASIPPLVSALFLFSLGIVTLFSRKREVLWRILAVFCFLLCAASATVFFIVLTDDPKEVTVAVRFAPFFGILALSFANYYAYILTGRSEKRRLFGHKPLTDRAFLISIAVVAVLLAVLLATGQFIADVEFEGLG